jgi:hypothetical protein
LIKNLGFAEDQTPYTSASQNARAWTEDWFRNQAFCPSCGNSQMTQFEANRPVADFICRTCDEEYELKSQKSKFGRKVVDGAYHTMCERLAANNNPNLFLLNYDLDQRSVSNLFVVPRHFFVREIIEERNPLSATARRAGWVGCNILLSQIPSAGKIHVVRDGILQPKGVVLSQWQSTLFMRNENATARGWLIEIMKCVEDIGKEEFLLSDVYSCEARLQKLFPHNHHVRHKIRQQLQVLRDRGLVDFLGHGRYRRRI